MTALVLGAAGCDSSGDALVAVITVDARVSASCIWLTVSEPPAGAPGALLGETRVIRSPGKTEYRVAVYRESLPLEVVFQAHAQGGTGCTPPLSTVISSQAVQRAFVPGRPRTVELSIAAPVVPPDHLAFRPPASSTIQTGSCVPVVVETRSADGGLAPVLSSTVVTFDVAPDAGLATYVDGTCTSPSPGVTIPPGASTATVQLRPTATGTFTVTATAPALGSDSLMVDVVSPPPSAVGFASAPFTALRGACTGPVRIQPVDGTGNPAPLPAAQTVSLSAGSADVTFAVDAQCMQSATQVSLPAGLSEASFYFSSRTSGPVVLQASSPALAAGTQAEEIIPNVRSGICRIDANQTVGSCLLMPGVFDAGKAFLVFQATSSDDNPGGASVLCTLLGTSTISCARDGATSVQVDVAWQLVELAQGIRVQRATYTCGTGTVMTLPQAVNLAEAFVLASSRVGGGEVGSDDYRTVRLLANDQVEVTHVGGCNGTNDIQVVELTGARVERGLISPATGLTATVGMLPVADLARSFLVYSWRMNGGSILCGNALRGELTSPTAVSFSRGDGSSACATPDVPAIAWERVELPVASRVQQVSISVPDGVLSGGANLPQGVDLGRTFAFSGGQWTVGQAWGETAWNLSDVPGVVTGRHFLSPDRLDLIRGTSTGITRFTSFVVELP